MKITQLFTSISFLFGFSNKKTDKIKTVVLKSTLICTLVLISILCQASITQREIKINGTVTGYPFSSKVVLINFETQSFFDTAFIMNGFFNFTISNSEPSYYGIQIGNGARPEMVNFFVEDVDISIYARFGELAQANIKGGKVQSDFDIFSIMNESITIRFDKAHDAFNQAFRENKMDKADSLKKVVFFRAAFKRYHLTQQNAATVLLFSDFQ
jgi:hypothetical protein